MIFNSGKNLDLAKSNLEKALSKFPVILIRKSYAICLHKIWMSTASNEDLKIKPVIDMPSFRDSMLFPGVLRQKGRYAEQLLAIKPLIQKRKKLIKR
ncbi:hypothetical protein E4414_00005 [Leptospira interrogans]|nr:hypothetical protein E4414_00005 [Leptospira interrogans]